MKDSTKYFWAGYLIGAAITVTSVFLWAVVGWLVA